MAKELGYRGVVVLGSELYYPRSEFQEAKVYGIEAPFEALRPNFMAIELIDYAL